MTAGRKADTLAGFLLARIAEDEAVAWVAKRDGYSTEAGLQYGECGYNTLPDLTIDPDRVLAECEAKRRIVEMYVTLVAEMDAAMAACGDNGVVVKGVQGVAYLHVIKALAAAYAEHPDYRQEWKP